MRGIFFLVALVTLLAGNCYADNRSCGDATKVAVEIKTAIETINEQNILGNIEEGVWFADESVSKNKIKKLLKDKKSWLYKLLFNETKSMRHYLCQGNIDIIIMPGKEHVIAYYASPGVDIALTPNIILMCANGRWVLTGIDIFYVD